MVTQAPKVDLVAEDYLWPLTTLRDTLLRPVSESLISPTKVRQLLQYHLEKLHNPATPFKRKDSASRASLQGSSITLPRTTVQLDVDRPSRSLALRLADAADVDEITAFVLWRSYAAHSLEAAATPAHGQSHEDALLERLVLWYEQELLAAPQIVMALYVPPAEPTGWEDAAVQLRENVLGDQAEYIEGLFRTFSTLAQQPVETENMLSRGLFWATLQLRQQETLLDLLFLILYQFTTRPANVSEALLKGAIYSSFGTAQANREIWEADAECQRLQVRIRDLVLVIAIEALCLAQIVSPTGDDAAKTFGGTLLHSRDCIHGVHQFLMEQSADLDTPAETMDGTLVFPSSPIPILCLAWAIVLRSLPANLQPPTDEHFTLDTADMGADEPVVFFTAASRALRLASGLFPWLEAVLEGPLFEASKDISGGLAVNMGALRRSPLKDLLIGLSELVQIGSIVDRQGLYRVWELLFGGGLPQASSLLSANYWGVDFVYDERRAILDQSFFPREPTQLPLLLSALTGVSTSEEIDVQQASDTMADVYDYLHELPYVTILSPPLSYTIIGSENGHSIVEAAIDIDLPGAVTIPRRTRGVIAQTNDGENPVIEWRFHQSAWPLLVEILRGAAGFSPNKARDPQALSLSLVELGVQGDLSNILSAGLKLIRCVLRSPDVANRFITEVSSAGEDFAGHALLDLALTVACDRTDMVGAQHAIEILQSLLLIGSPEIWQAFRAIGFFDSHMRRKGSIAGLIQSDAMRGQHGLTLALLRLVRSIATANAGDPVVVRAAIKLIVTEVWSQFSGWRYRDVSERYKIAALIADIFDTVLRHPLGEDGKTHSPAAAYLIDIFISSASLLTYKPIVDVFTQSESLATRLIQSRRWVDADAVLHTFDQAASLLATLVRIASSLSIPTSALPYSAFASTVVLAGGDKVRFVDALFDLIPEQTLQPSSLRLVIRLLKVYLETATRDASRPSLAGMLRDAAKTCEKVAAVAFNSALNDVKPDAWALLGVIIATQPGCAFFCFGTPLDKQKADDKNSDKGKQKEGEPAKAKITGPLKMAVDETLAWDDLMTDGPRALAAILAYLQSVIECPSASTSVSALRTHPDFWKAVYDISIKNVPLPSSFSERIALDVQDYSYRMQAKANATALLAAELVLVLDTDGPETKAQTLALSLFRNASLLEDVVVGTIHSSCDPELQNGEQSSLSSNRVHLAREQTVCLRSERDYGVDYLFDGKPVILNDPDAQAAVLRSLAILNMNWSQLDADVSYTKAWRTFAEVVSTWTAGDALAAKATLKAANAAAALLAQEDRGGDVMLAIQTERLGILSTLLETALDPESEVPDPKAVKDLARSVRRIVESGLFPPILSLRHKELPPIHRPVLRILLLLSQAQTDAAEIEVREVLFDCGATFALEAADIALDTIVAEPSVASEQDLALIVSLMCQISRAPDAATSLLDKLQGSNIIPRSLEIIVRTRPVGDVLPPHLQTILLLHLAIASCGPTAEKLAMAGVLPAYADNVVAVAAEEARVDPDNESLHQAWCGILMVVKALLATLPNISSFARAEVVPLVRVVMPQLYRALAWGGETPLSRPVLDELSLAVDVFYGLAAALGAGPTAQADTLSLLDDFALPAIDLLRGVRFALSHPHRFCGLLVPATEDEQAALEKELATVEAQKDDINLVDAKLPTIAARTAEIVGIARTVLVTLAQLSHAWEILDGGAEPRAECLLGGEGDSPGGGALSASADPVGIVNDLYVLIGGLQVKLASSATTARETASQAVEAAGLLSLTQLLVRRALFPSPDDEPADDEMDEDDSTPGPAGIGGAGLARSTAGSTKPLGLGLSRRRSISMNSLSGKAHRAAQIRHELESDVRGMLGDNGGNPVLEIMRGIAVERFPE